MKMKMKFVGVVVGLVMSLFGGALGQVAQDEVKATLRAGGDGGGGALIVEARGVPAKAPLFFTASSEQVVTVTSDAVRQSVSLHYKKLQGEDEVMSLVLNHKVDVKSVRGKGLKEWSVREVDGVHYLDVRMTNPKAEELKLVMEAELLLDGGETKPVVRLMTLGIPEGNGAGFSEAITIIKKGVQVNVTKAFGCVAAKPLLPNSIVFLSNEEADIELSILKYEGDYAGIDLRGVSLKGRVDADGESAVVRLRGELHVREVSEEPFYLLRGKVALTRVPEVGLFGGKLEIRSGKTGMHYGVVCKRVGVYPIDLEFAVPISSGTGWDTMNFVVPNGAVVPLEISELDGEIEFRDDRSTNMDFKDELSLWRGVLPASGLCDLQWRTKSRAGDGELFYTSHGVSEISIGSGLMHAVSTVTFKVLQGKMGKVEFDMAGAGEVVSVVGSQVGSWKVTEVAGKRVLECELKAETSDVSYVRVASQLPLGKFPTKVEPLSLTPRGTMRHSGFVRVSNSGAVRVETSVTEGLMQLSPDKFPSSGAKVKGSQQFVYRYPSADRRLIVSADQIISEVSVSHITTYEMSETDRVIEADVEIDISEARLREWSFMIPAEYSVSGVSSANMVDHVVSTTVENGMRSLKVLFGGEVIGRQLIRVRLEKNMSAAEGEWSLPVLAFPGVKSVRGDIGILSVSGWKMKPVEGSVESLDERPLAYFPKSNAVGDRLQHAYRTRSGEWGVRLEISAMGQSIQSDLLHLYHLKEGIMEAKVLAYYFVIGAPANEWKLQLPGSAENVSVEGQNVRTWHQDGEVLIVTLNQPVLGGAKLLVTYEEPMNASGGRINIGSVTPLGVQSESGYIHLVSSHQVKVSEVDKSEGLLRISPLEMPSEHQVLTSVPSVEAWQYASRPFGLSLTVETLELVKSLSQAVGAASLNTRVTSAGEVVTNATFLVNTRGKKALKMKLPEGNRLWTAKADGELINARIDGDELILPLPATKDANRYRELEIRYGGTSEDPRKVSVGPPVLSAPLTIAEWKVSGDNHLTPIGGNVKPLQMVVSRNGFDQLANEYRLLAGVMFLMLGGIFLLRSEVRDRWLILFGNLWLVATVVCCLIFGGNSIDTDVASFKEFDVVAPVVGEQEVVMLELANDSSAPSSLSGVGVFLMLAGVGLLVVGMVREELATTLVRASAVFVLLLGCLMHVGGAAYFYFVIGIFAALLLMRGIPKLLGQWNFESKSKKSVTVVGLLLVSFMGLMSDVSAADGVADSMVESWDVSEGKLSSELQVVWNAEEGQSLQVLRAPAVLLGAEGDGFRVIKVKEKVDGAMVWKLIAEESGEIRADVRYEMSFKDMAELAVNVPSGQAGVKSLEVVVDQAGWKISSAEAVRSEDLLDVGEGASGQRLTLLGMANATVMLKPMPRDRSKEKLRFLAEVADVYVPAPGVLDGRHKLKIKPLDGEVKELTVEIPDGLMVGNVVGGALDSWRFDAGQKVLTVTMKRALVQDFELMIMTQRGVKAYPQDLVLESVVVRGAATTVGAIGYGFGEDSQPDNAKVVDLLEINITDFDSDLLRAARDVQARFVLHKAYRYGEKRGKIDLRVAAVSPEIRVQTQQTIRLTDERMSLQVQAMVNITRAGVFELKFYVPEGLDVEAINSPALRDWSVVDVNGRRLATMFLNGKTMGEHGFAITLLGDAPEVDPGVEADVWGVPRWLLEGVSRQRGVLTLVPDHGIRLRVAERQHASQVDSKGNVGENKGSLAFRLLQKDWKISLNVEQLDPWITAEILQQVNVREGLTKHWMNLHFHVDHAVVKQFQVRIPGVGVEQSNQLRASGPAVKEIVHVEGDVWQVNLRRGVIGDVPVQIGYQELKLRDGDVEVISPVQLLDTKQTTHYVAVRAPGQLELSAAELREWRGFDWGNVPGKLYNISDRSEPSLCYRVMDAGVNMDLGVKRHSMAGTLKLRVESGEMRTMFSADGSALSRLSLAVNVAEKSSLRISLPVGAELFNVIVNEKSAEVVKEAGAENTFTYWFLVSESIKENELATVQITYEMRAGERGGGKVTLLGPILSIPLENIDWFVMLPDGYDMSGYEGEFVYEDTIYNDDLGSYADAFREIKKARYFQLREEGKLELDRAMGYSNGGEIDKANAALHRVIRNQAVDAASNEDARVKLESNMTSQAIMGLNTRSQRSYMDNKAMGNTQYDNNALEEAVSRNPFFLGSRNFNPNQLGDLMQGNSDEEILAMQRIAQKLVKPQLVSTNAGQAVELEILETRKVVHFRKDVHLAGDSGLAIQLELDQASLTGKGVSSHSSSSNFGLILLLAIISFLGMWLAKR
ncbi:MAG: hypothetical protein ACSHX6_01535 [Akkermansiaceae bacterium]